MMRNVWKGMVVGAIVGAALDGTVEAGRRGSAIGRRVGRQGRAVAHTAAERVEAADLPGSIEGLASSARDKFHDVAG